MTKNKLFFAFQSWHELNIQFLLGLPFSTFLFKGCVCVCMVYGVRWFCLAIRDLFSIHEERVRSISETCANTHLALKYPPLPEEDFRPIRKLLLKKGQEVIFIKANLFVQNPTIKHLSHMYLTTLGGFDNCLLDLKIFAKIEQVQRDNGLLI